MTTPRNTRDESYVDALYGSDGTHARCVHCAGPADYLHRAEPAVAWADAQARCLTCFPRAGRPPHHGERAVRQWLSAHPCQTCGQPAVHLITGAGDPPATAVRRGQVPRQDVDRILAASSTACSAHVPASTLGPAKSSALHPFADPVKLAAALRDVRAVSWAAVARLMGVSSGGSTTLSLQRWHARHTAADPGFPALPTKR